MSFLKAIFFFLMHVIILLIMKLVQFLRLKENYFHNILLNRCFLVAVACDL